MGTNLIAFLKAWYKKSGKGSFRHFPENPDERNEVDHDRNEERHNERNNQEEGEAIHNTAEEDWAGQRTDQKQGRREEGGTTKMSKKLETSCTDSEKLEWWISKGSGEAKCKARIGETGEDH